MQINSLDCPSVTVARTAGIVPPNGPRAVIVDLDFAAAAQYVLDYSNAMRSGQLDMVQTIWVDNYGSSSVLQIDIPTSRQRIVVPVGVQGYFPVICPNPAKLIFSSASGLKLQATLLNYQVWS